MKAGGPVGPPRPEVQPWGGTGSGITLLWTKLCGSKCDDCEVFGNQVLAPGSMSEAEDLEE